MNTRLWHAACAYNACVRIELCVGRLPEAYAALRRFHVCRTHPPFRVPLLSLLPPAPSLYDPLSPALLQSRHDDSLVVRPPSRPPLRLRSPPPSTTSTPPSPPPPSPSPSSHMGNTVSRSHIRDADRGVAKATRANTRRNSSNPAPPPPLISTPTSSSSSAPHDDALSQSSPPIPENRHSYTFGVDDEPSPSRPVKRRARHVSAEPSFQDSPNAPFPDPREPLPDASPAEVHAARTETPPLADKPPRARKVVSFNDKVHIVTYPYDGSAHSSTEFTSLSIYPEPKYPRRRSRSVFRLLSRTPSDDHQCLNHDSYCGLRIASDAQIVYDDLTTAAPDTRTADSPTHLRNHNIVVSYERPYVDSVPDDFDYVHRRNDDDDSFSLPDAHPSCEVIEEPEAIGDQLLARDDSRDSPAFDIAPLWQRLKRVDELDTVARNTFLRDSARRRHNFESKPPRPPRREKFSISHSKVNRGKTRRSYGALIADDNPADQNDKAFFSSRLDHVDKTRSISREISESDAISKNEKPAAKRSRDDTIEIRHSVRQLSSTSASSPDSTPGPLIDPTKPSVATGRGGVHSPRKSEERKLPAPARARATSAGSIQKHMASFTTDSIASNDRDSCDERSGDRYLSAQESSFEVHPTLSSSSSVKAETKVDQVTDKAFPWETASPGDNTENENAIPMHTVEPTDVTTTSSSHLQDNVADDTSPSIPKDVDTVAPIPMHMVEPTDVTTTSSSQLQHNVADEISPSIPKEASAQAALSYSKDGFSEEESELMNEPVAHSWARLNDIADSELIEASRLPESDSDDAADSSTEDHGNMVAVSESPTVAEDGIGTFDLKLDSLCLPSSEDYSIAPCSPVQEYSPVAGVFYGNSSPSLLESSSPRIPRIGSGGIADYPEYDMLNGSIHDDSLFGSEPSTPVSGAPPVWEEPFEDQYLTMDDDVRMRNHSSRNTNVRDRNGRQPLPEVLLHDWSGDTPVEPNIEMVDSAPNSRSSATPTAARGNRPKESSKLLAKNGAAFSAKRGSPQLPKSYLGAGTPSLSGQPSSEREGRASDLIVEVAASNEIKDRSDLKSMRSMKSRRDGMRKETSKYRSHVRARLPDSSKKFSLSNTEAWVSSDYEVGEPESRARSEVHKSGVIPFTPGLPAGYAPDPKLVDFQHSVERHSFSEIGYRKGGREGRGASFAQRERAEERNNLSAEGKQDSGSKRLVLPQVRRGHSNMETGVDNPVRDDGNAIRGMMTRLVSGMHMAKKLVVPH